MILWVVDSSASLAAKAAFRRRVFPLRAGFLSRVSGCFFARIPLFFVFIFSASLFGGPFFVRFSLGN